MPHHETTATDRRIMNVLSSGHEGQNRLSGLQGLDAVDVNHCHEGKRIGFRIVDH